MKWLNHTLIAGAICAVVSPPHVAVCVAGATAPDWFEYVLKVGNRHIKHRGPTHVFMHWLLAALAFTLVWDYHGIGMAFAWGGVSHILTDAMTVSGGPFSPYSDRRFHLFGGRFRTSDPIEYAISAGVVVVCIALSHLTGGHGLAPFFYDWGGMYQEGVIDGLEWKTNRFRLI
ncbi:inner membrane protein [Vibrio crassostreae]|nr:inner membrane protein [Vibrio crassostreae]CAK2043407.1 inner membrane protein [Vibrio crassostreae]CAK2054025.1 inner membrane protein [Vibrio crassostreae]CAK2331786.1 inner membrane protein [Vibrio crassostreae]CAK2722938.1 inner membrane protein [Vibrio crassostreae]